MLTQHNNHKLRVVFTNEADTSRKWKLWDAPFIVMDFIYDPIHYRFSGDRVVLIHAGDAGSPFPQLFFEYPRLSVIAFNVTLGLLKAIVDRTLLSCDIGLSLVT
jgi:hypothetical protein